MKLLKPKLIKTANVIGSSMWAIIKFIVMSVIGGVAFGLLFQGWSWLLGPEYITAAFNLSIFSIFPLIAIGIWVDWLFDDANDWGV